MNNKMLYVSELGFAAFLILKGHKLVGYSNSKFIFETEQSDSELRIEWVNSDFAKFDKVILDLKQFRK